MKALLLTCLVVGATGIALAQGQFTFANRFTAAGIDAKIFLYGGVTPASGPNYVAQAYIGLEGDSLQPVGDVVPFRTGSAAGYITGTPTRTPYAGGTAILVQLRAWEVRYGGTYEQAVAAGGWFGMSNLVPLTVTEAPAPPADMVGLQSFMLIPEPSVFALLGLGAFAVLARRQGGRGPDRGQRKQTAGLTGDGR